MITPKNDIYKVNEHLRNVYGRDLLGRPYFRIVWSDEQLETRIGKVAEYYGHIFVREVDGAHKVPKYSWIKHRWILEKLMYFDNPPRELPDTHKGSYEPIYVFWYPDHSPEPVTWDKVNWIVNTLTQRRPERRTEAMDEAEENAAFEREVKKNEEMLDLSVTQAKLHAGEAILNPGTGE